MQNLVVISAIAAGVSAYLIGSIPFGYLIGKAHGVDLRTVGSGNIGATNAARVLGRKWFFAVFALDFAKGCGPVLIGYLLRWLADRHQLGQVELADLMLVAGLGACLGHVFPIYLGFRGGKAVATGLGVVTAMLPLAGVMCLGIFMLLLLLSKYVSLASMAAALAAPGAFFIYYQDSTWDAPQLARFLMISGAALLVVYRHRENIKRLLNGTERRLNFGKGEAA